MSIVSCSICNHFTPGSGSGQGIGRCKIFEAYRSKNPGKTAIRKALMSLGNDPYQNGDVFTGGTLVDRNCAKFEGMA